MKKFFPSIFALTLILASCTDMGYISKEEMAGILYGFLLTDRCLDEAGSFRLQADTTIVYKPVLDEAGYTQEEFVRSLKHWLSNAKDMKDIYAMTNSMLEERREFLQAQIDEQERLEMEEKRIRDSLERIETRPAKLEQEHIRQEKIEGRNASKSGRKRVSDKMELKTVAPSV